MTREIHQGGAQAPLKKDDANKLLGKRHDYDAEVQPSMRRAASTIGFSQREIFELERIYQTGLKEPKMSSDKTDRAGANKWLFFGGVGLLMLIAATGVNLFMSNDERSGSATLATHSSDPCTLNEAVVQKIKAASIGEVRAFAPMDRPYSLAEFRFKDESGASKTIADWKGRIVLVNLWATWCAPCRAEMPSLDKLQGTLGSDDFEVLPISVDRSEPSKPKGFFEEISIKEMGFYHDKEAMTLNALKREGLALGLPATLLVDGRGCAIGRLNGPAEWASPDAQNLIKAAF